MNEQHIGVFKAFADRILNGGPLIAEGREGINGLTLSNAMYLSSWLDKTVDIPFDEDLFLQTVIRADRGWWHYPDWFARAADRYIKTFA